MDKWSYEKTDLPQGAYFRIDYAENKIAVIFPNNQQEPIEQGENAMLMTRDFGKDDWKEGGVHTFDKAKRIGDQHVKQYAHDLADKLIDQMRSRGRSRRDRDSSDRGR